MPGKRVLHMNHTEGKELKLIYTAIFIRTFSYENVQPEICKNIKNMLRTYPRLREEQYNFHCDSENLNFIITCMESECT